MDKVVVNSYEDFEKLLGRQIGISDYVEVSQTELIFLQMLPWIISGFM